MFTGIVEELGTVERVEDQGDAVRLTIRAETVLDDVRPGDSIAVNGCCLTVGGPTTERTGRPVDRRRHAGDARPDLAARGQAR